LKGCPECAGYQRGAPPRQTQLKPTPIGAPWERLSIDITGKHPRSSLGYEWILTVVDHCTKWAEAIPLRNHTAVTVAKALYEVVFTRYGVPLQLLSDRGPEFESELISELCKWLGIDKLRTTPYKPSTNAVVERFHRTLNSILAKMVRENQRDWCSRLQTAMAAYRASVHESTGYSPNRLLLGQEVRAPIDVVLGAPGSDGASYESHDDFVCKRQRIARETFTLVREQLGRAAEKRKRDYDIRVRGKEFDVGQWVWYYYPRRYRGRSPKWQRYYTGPFLIVRLILPSDAVLQKSKSSRPFVVHFDKLKLCQGVTPDSWLTQGGALDGTASGGDRNDPPNVVDTPAPGDRQQTGGQDPTIDDQGTLDYDQPIVDDTTQRGRRSRRRPAKFDDYVTGSGRH
jgi:transposase InsO family protein